MKIFTIKLILSRSNPQVIRELQIEAHRTIDELQDAAKAVFLDDPKSCKSVIFRMDGYSVSSHSQLSDVLDTGSCAQIHLSLRTTPSCDLHLEVLALHDTPDFAGPCVTRFRPDCSSFSNIAFFPESAEKDYQENLAKLNRNLTRLFRPGDMPPELCKAISIRLSRILDSYTVAELKQLAKRFHLTYYNGQRKSALINTLCSEMDQDSYWNSILSSLTCSEYQAMNTLCITGHLPDPSADFWDVLPQLSQRSLLAHDSSGVTRIAEEFMEFYEHWLETNNERQFLLRLCYRTVLKAASLLYGFVDQQLAEELMIHCYPDICQKNNLSDLWKPETGALNTFLKKLNVSTCFNIQKFNREAAEELRSNFVLKNRIHYIPDRSTLEHIVMYGYRLDPEIENEYRRLLQKHRCSPYHISYSAAEVAQLTYYAYPQDEILDYCQDTLRLKDSSPALKDISDFLKRHKQDFRLLPLAGLTESEFEVQQRDQRKASTVTKAKHIYPNDPCPCGSGKKYKVCCGRKRS